MMAIQLPLIEEIDPIQSAVTPVGEVGKFRAPSCVGDALALFTLLSSPSPLEVLCRIAGRESGIDLIYHLRQYGLVLPCTEVQVDDGTGQIQRRVVCALSPADTRRVTRWLKKSGGRHG